MRPPRAILLPLRQLASFDSQPKATNLAFHGPFCCLCDNRLLSTYGQRQLIRPSAGYSAAFAKNQFLNPRPKGSKPPHLKPCLLPPSKISFSHQIQRQQTDPPEAMFAASAKNQFLNPTQKAADRPTLSHICCLCQNQFSNPKTKITNSYSPCSSTTIISWCIALIILPNTSAVRSLSDEVLMQG